MNRPDTVDVFNGELIIKPVRLGEEYQVSDINFGIK